MPDDKTIPELTDAGTIAATDQVPVSRAGITKRVQVGTAAGKNTGTSVGELAALVDVGGGTAGLPAVDGSRLKDTVMEVETWAALEALAITYLAQGKLAYLKGYYSTGDGGEGFFWLDKDTGSGGLSNGGTIAATPDADSYWRRIVPNAVYTADMFGGKRGDASVDCGTAIRACLTAHGACHLLAGTYHVATTITIDSGQMLLGQGMHQTTCKQPDNNANLPAVAPSSGWNMVQNASYPNGDGQIVVRGIDFDMNGANNASAAVTSGADSGAWTTAGATVEFTALSAVVLRGSQNDIIACGFKGFRGGVSVSGGTGKEAFVAYASNDPNAARAQNGIEFCWFRDPAPQTQSGTANREITLAFVGSGDQQDNTYPPTARGSWIRNCRFENLHFCPGGTAWTNSGSKNKGGLYTNAGSIYRCNTTHTSTGGSFGDDAANFDLIGAVATWVQKSPLNLTSANGWHVEVSGNTFDNCDGACFYFDTAELVGLRWHDNRAYNVSTLFSCNINDTAMGDGTVQTDRFEDVCFYNNDVRIGRYVAGRNDTGAGSTIFRAWRINVNGQPGYGNADGFRLWGNLIEAHGETQYGEYTRMGLIYATSGTDFLKFENFDVRDNIFKFGGSGVEPMLQYGSSTAYPSRARWQNNRNEDGALVHLWMLNSAGTQKAIVPEQGMTQQATQLVVADASYLVEDHFEQPAAVSASGDVSMSRAGWSVAVVNGGATEAGVWSAGAPGVVRLKTGSSAGDRSVALHLHGLVQLGDFSHWRMRCKWRLGHTVDGTTGTKVSLVMGLANNTDPIHDTFPNAVPQSITKGVYVLVGSGNATPDYFVRCFLHNSATGTEKLSATNSPNTDWHTTEIVVWNTGGTPHVQFFLDDVLIGQITSMTHLPDADDMFPFIGLGQDSTIVAVDATERWAEIDKVLVQGFEAKF